ncbi:MAG: DUF4252 domain-containing protein [Bacteroidales bacterium]|nr:DUF4252 domain-containing protein [Bacteroidales bacterium]
MKKLYTIVLLLTLCMTALAQSGRDLYNKYSDLPGTEAVYISSAMFRLIGRIPDVELKEDSVNFSPIIKSMTGFYILNTSDPKTGAALYAEVNQFVHSGKYELLMEAKDNGEVMRMYTVGDAATVTSFVMLTKDGADVSFISFDGKMDREQLENILADAAAPKNSVE